jgi:hypothetical protein
MTYRRQPRGLSLALFASCSAAALVLSGCAGEPGADGSSCSVEENTDGSATISCDDGTEVTVEAGADGSDGSDGSDGTNGTNGTNGTDGTDGADCSVTDNMDGTKTVSCDGVDVVVSDGSDCTVTDNMDGTRTITCDDGTSTVIPEGMDGLDVGELRGLVVMASATSTPANGTHYVTGETITLEATLWDEMGYPLALDDLNRARLYGYGPLDPALTVNATALLGASEDRSQTHHYLDLAADPAPTNLTVSGNTLTFVTNAVSSEAAGTYTFGFRMRSAESNLTATLEFIDVQIGTATAETPVNNYTENCKRCHEGATNGYLYLHHNDRGSVELDNNGLKACKMCHNNDGYAAVRICDDGSVAVRDANGVRRCEDGSENYSYVSDAIVLRVHGVHNGSNLTNPTNVNPDWGLYSDFLDLHFPADVRNCDTCHADDSWSNKPTRMACGACHDHVDFATGTGHEAAPTGSEIQTDDTNCATCHNVANITTMHEVAPPAFAFDVEIGMTAPANTTHYVAGESPDVTVTVKLAGTQTIVDPTTIDETYSRVNLFVSGPREHTEPVLTSAATGTANIRAMVTTGDGPFDLDAISILELDIDGNGTISLDVTNGTFTAGAATATEVVGWLTAETAFTNVATASVDDDAVVIKSNTKGAGSSVEVVGGDAVAALGLTTGTWLPTETHYYANNDLRLHADSFDDDGRVTRSSTEYTYSLDNVDGLESGTYTVFVEVGQAPPMSWAKYNFQVGTATADDYVATSCVDCHAETRMHAGFFAVEFDPDICKSCHDYERQILGSPGWGIIPANWGFGAAPLARRVHGVHRGKYLDKPGEVTEQFLYDYSGVIFPQDIRNCQKCHSESDEFTHPSRLACNACHDSDEAIAHTTLMTLDPTPADPWNGDEMESCNACHGEDSEFAVEKVHNVSDPYVGPYRR